MKLADVILLSLTIAFMIMGVHQVMRVGFGNAYWALMLALVILFLYKLSRLTS